MEKIKMPNAPIVDVAAAIVKTIVNPGAANIAADVELVIELFKDIELKLAGAHPTALQVFKILLGEL